MLGLCTNGSDINKATTMTMTYIFHSGFVLETEKSILIFDYWLDLNGVVLLGNRLMATSDIGLASSQIWICTMKS